MRCPKNKYIPLFLVGFGRVDTGFPRISTVGLAGKQKSEELGKQEDVEGGFPGHVTYRKAWLAAYREGQLANQIPKGVDPSVEQLIADIVAGMHQDRGGRSDGNLKKFLCAGLDCNGVLVLDCGVRITECREGTREPPQSTLAAVGRTVSRLLSLDGAHSRIRRSSHCQ